MKYKFAIIVLLFIAMLFVIASSYTWAQNLPGGIWASPQSAATEGRYRSNADDFIRPDTHSGVRFNKWFGIVAFKADENYNPLASVGFATKVNDLYVGAFYSGNFWAGTPANNYTEQMYTAGNVPAGGAADKTYNVYNNINVTSQSVNNIALLFGFADMGLRLTFRTNHLLFNQSDIVTGNQLYSSYHAENGYIAPQIAWAMSKDMVSGKGVRPYITVDLLFNRSYLKTETKGADTNSITGERIQRSANEFSPSLGLGLGGYHFYNQDGFRATLDVDYTFTTTIYDNEYSYIENEQYKTGKISGTYNPGSFPLVERNYFTTTLTPSVAGSWSKERLALRFKLNIPLTLAIEEASTMAVNGSSLIKNGNSDTITTFTIRPDIRLALQYKLIPDRLTLNAGARIQASALILETVDHDYYNADGQKAASLTTKIHRDSFGSSIASRFHIGPTFFFTENAWVEANTGVSNAYGDNAIEIFASGGLFSFGSILVCLKF